MRKTDPMKKTVLITGAGSGIGKASAIKLKERGHRVIATAHHANQVETLRSLGFESFVLDITKESDRKKVHEYSLDVLINNAGMGETGSLAEIDIEKVRANFEVNVFSTFALTQEVLKRMIPRKRGTIVFVSSLLGRTTSPFFAPYSMSKHALSSGARMLADELSLLSKNIHLRVIEPGAYHTGFNQKMMAKKYEWMERHSYFHEQLASLRKREDSQFRLIEVAKVDSIVTQIVKAVESDSLQFRYTAPWWQAWYIQFLRVRGS